MVMKATRHHKMLGIAVGEKSMLLAELHAGSPAPQILRTAQFDYPQGTTLKDSEPLGHALGEFLKANGFGARAAVFGIPAKWVLTKQKEVPTADERLVADTLRLQSQAEFSPELSDLVYDYSGATGADGSNSVLLAAVPRKYLDQLSAVAEAARIKLEALTPYAAALATATAPASAGGLMLLLGPGGVEFATQDGGFPRSMRYIGASADASPALIGELRRASTQTAPNGSVAANGVRREMIIWNDAGADEAPIRALQDAVGLSFRTGGMADLGVEPSAAGKNGRDYGAAVSLALSGLSPRASTIDFVHSRLAPPPEKRVDRRTVLLIAAAAAIVLGTGFWAWTLYSQQNAVDAARKQLVDEKPNRDLVLKEVAKMESAVLWHAGNPKFIACLRDLTEACPDSRNPFLFANALSLDENLKGTLTGKSGTDRVVYALADALKASKKFSSVQTSTERSQSRQGDEYSFRINFQYKP